MRAFALLFLFAFTVNCAIELDYGIMIDAGSSGSRIYLYQWPHRDENTLPLVEPTSINQTVVSLKTNTALSSFANNPDNVGSSLDPLIAYIKANLDTAKYAVTPLYLKATAGMRALNQSAQDSIIASVRKYLHTTPFQFADSHANVIPGTEEGLFGWITVNYALKVLTLSNPATNGALDMGGASTQITFRPAAPPVQNNFNMSLGPNIFPLYTYSYPIGQDQSLRNILDGLANDKVFDGNGNLLMPCYIVGYNESYQSVMAVGTGNYSACRDAVLKYLVTTDSNCASTCGIGNVYQPPVTGDFYAFSAFAYTNQFFGLSSTATITDLRNAGITFCNLNFAAAQAKYPTQTANYLKNYCFTPTYFSEILLKYGFSDTSTQIHTQTSVGSIELTWALGGMIYEANLLPFGDNTGASSVLVASGMYGIVALLLALLM